MHSAKFSIKIVALILSGIVLIGSVGVSLDFHICQGKVKTFSIFGIAESCSAMEMNSKCDSSSEESAFTRKKCCSNESVYSSVSFQTDMSLDSPKQKGATTHSPHATIDYHRKEITLSNSTKTVIPDPPVIRHRSSDIIVCQTFLI
jgi:hypothetical protein